MACVRETERFSRFAVARDETNKEAVSDVSLKSAWGTSVGLTMNKEKREV